MKKIPIVRLTEESTTSLEDLVVREFPLTILLNNREVVTLLCSPKDLRYLAAGFLFSEGLVTSKGEIKKILVDDRRGVVQVETGEVKALTDKPAFKRSIASSGSKGVSFYKSADRQSYAKIESQTRISTHEVFTLMDEFIQRSEIFKATGGVHSAALCDTENILVFNEDIGRHNAIDKIFGKCLLEDIPTDGRIVITSGRISSEILLKVAMRNIPIIISKSAPTDLGVKLASDSGITLLGFVRGTRINAYASDWRILSNGKR
ncbi:formate dehydrogenase accessory sulfurtransferase FdhD [Chloroflexota bacterium]